MSEVKERGQQRQGETSERPGSRQRRVSSAEAAAWNPHLESGEQQKGQGLGPQAWAAGGWIQAQIQPGSMCEVSRLLGQELRSGLTVILALRSVCRQTDLHTCVEERFEEKAEPQECTI